MASTNHTWKTAILSSYCMSSKWCPQTTHEKPPFSPQVWTASRAACTNNAWKTTILAAGLNSLQSGLHKQHMKDLFVELCLTVPVRLSSLLPYLPMLMDPLVSALNGSQTLVSQVRESSSGRTAAIRRLRRRTAFRVKTNLDGCYNY